MTGLPPPLACALPVAACVVLALACGAERPSEPARRRGAPVRLTGIATTVRGVPVTEGASCEVAVEHTTHAAYSCRVRVRCGRELVYGLADAGYNRCEEVGGRIVAAEDPLGTRRDGDPRMQLDLELGRLVVSDEDPDLYLGVSLRREAEASGAP